MREFTIKIQIHDRTELGSLCRRNYDGWLIKIDETEVRSNNLDLNSVILHEVGHALGEALKFPIHDQLLYSSYQTLPQMIMKEEEAWGIAMKLFYKTKDFALSTYRNSLPRGAPLTTSEGIRV